MRLKRVPLFDLGNVLIQVEFRPFREWFADIVKVDSDSALARLARTEHYFRYERDELSCQEFTELIRKEFNADFSHAEFRHKFSNVFPAWIPGMIELIREMRDENQDVYVLSNTCRMHIEVLHEQNPAEMQLFTSLITSYDLGMRKPDPAIYIETARRLGVEPEQIVFFDDLEENVLAARKAGLESHIFEGVGQVREILAKNC